MMKQDTGNMDSRSITIDMGNAGTIAFGGHGLDSVVGGVDDVMPTAYGETWDIISNTVDNGGVTSTASTLFGAIGSAGSNNMMRYDNTTAVEGLKISASYVPSGTGEVESSVDYGLEYTGYEGLTLGYAMGENNAAGGTSNTDNDTMYVKYAYGPVTVGYQKSEIDANTAMILTNGLHMVLLTLYQIIYQLVTVSLLTMQVVQLLTKKTLTYQYHTLKVE